MPGIDERQQFASDNYSGICPEVLACIEEANTGHVASYGEDRWTAEACDLFREVFEAPCEVFFVSTGTAANALALASLCRSYHSMICHRLSHVETDECGAPEFYSHGAKLLMADGPDGKIQPSSIRALATKRTDIHYPKAKVVSLTQATEVGTVYNPVELQAIRSAKDELGLKAHMDGARFANAVVSLGVRPREITIEAGIDVLSLGGSKNGLALGEAVVFFDLEAADEFAYRCKQTGQLTSKMRFIAAQWLGALKDGAWLRRAEHANRCAAQLEAEVSQMQALRILFPRQANSVFVEMPQPVAKALRAKGWRFYSFIGDGGMRLMCSWDMREETIQAFVRDLREALN